MIYRRLGSLSVSALGFGTWQLGGPTTFGSTQIGWGEIDEAEGKRALQRALEVGINFFDTADLYGHGHAEELLGQATAGATTTTYICTKFGNRQDRAGRIYQDFSAAWLSTCVERSLRRLRRETIDVLLLHSPAADFDWSRYDPAPWEQLQRAGKIREYGVSGRLHVAEQAIRHSFGKVVEVIYNVLDRRAEDAVIPEASRRGVSVIARVPLASGYLSDAMRKDTITFSPTDNRQYLPAAENKWRRAAVARLDFLAAQPGGGCPPPPSAFVWPIPL